MAEAVNKPGAQAGQEGGEAAAKRDWDRRTNMLALLLMALATLGSSWSGYQAALWDGIQTFLLMDAASQSRDADEKALTANGQRAIDGALFVEYARDLYTGRGPLAEFFLARMRPELQHAIQAWIATQPLKNPNAPATPFVMPQYRLRVDDEARESAAKSDATYKQARKANLNSDTYMLLGVLFTASLFLAGLIGGFTEKTMRRMVLILSLVALLMALVVMAGLPIAHRG
jgi:hypothetical protein